MAIFLSAQVIDRLAITIGYQTITELEIDEELRVTALLNHKGILRDENARRDAGDRLVQQSLLKHDMEVSRYGEPTASEVANYTARVEEQLSSPADLEGELRKYNLDRATLERHLALQFKTLQFVDFRFRSEFSVGDADVNAFLQKQPAETVAGQANPPIKLSRADAKEYLINQRTDESLNAWLEEARKRFNIVYLDKALQ